MKIKKLTIISIVAVLLLDSLICSSLARPNKEIWVEFAVIEGQYVGERDRIKVYYDQASLEIREDGCDVWVKIRCEDKMLPTVVKLVKYPYGWVYFNSANRVYHRGSAGVSSRIEPMPIAKGSVLYLLPQTLKRQHPSLKFKD